MQLARQQARTLFFTALDRYRNALASGTSTPASKAAFIAASLAVHAAKVHAPKRLWPLVNRAYRQHQAP